MLAIYHNLNQSLLIPSFARAASEGARVLQAGATAGQEAEEEGSCVTDWGCGFLLPYSCGHIEVHTSKTEALYGTVV